MPRTGSPEACNLKVAWDIDIIPTARRSRAMQLHSTNPMFLELEFVLYHAKAPTRNPPSHVKLEAFHNLSSPTTPEKQGGV